jgi:hypothetical protein
MPTLRQGNACWREPDRRVAPTTARCSRGEVRIGQQAALFEAQGRDAVAAEELRAHPHESAVDVELSGVGVSGLLGDEAHHGTQAERGRHGRGGKLGKGEQLEEKGPAWRIDPGQKFGGRASRIIADGSRRSLSPETHRNLSTLSPSLYQICTSAYQ